MTYEKLQDLIEINRNELIDIVESVGCYTHDALQFAIEEYTLGMECDQYSYHNYREHFQKRYLKYPNGTPRFGQLMTEVLDHLFIQQIGPSYVEIKKMAYKEMDKYKQNGELWNTNLVANYEQWVGYVCDVIMGENKTFTHDWNKIKKTKTK